MKIVYTAGAKESKTPEVQAVKELERLLSSEKGFLMPNVFIGVDKDRSNREIDAILVLHDAIFLLDFKNWGGQRIEVEGLNGRVRRLRNGAWKDEKNTLVSYEYAAKELPGLLKKAVPQCPRVNAVLVFTSFGLDSEQKPQVSFAGGDPQRPQIKQGVTACRLEQLPKVIANFRATAAPHAQLGAVELAQIQKLLHSAIKEPAQPRQRSVEGYAILNEHHQDPFLNCTIYAGESETLQEPVWIKEYARELTTPEQRKQQQRLALRHGDVLSRLQQQQQHPNIVSYCASQATDFHLYVILARRPGIFLNEFISGEPQGTTTSAELKKIPSTLATRLAILGDLLKALEFLTRQPDFEKSAYRDLRPESVFVQYNGEAKPVAQLFHFDNMKLDGAKTAQAATRLRFLKEGKRRAATWDEYAAPELVEYIDRSQQKGNKGTSFNGDVSSDIYSWGIIAWELLIGERPFANSVAKDNDMRKPWPAQLPSSIAKAGERLSPDQIRLIPACLDVKPAQRPTLANLRQHFR